MKQKYQLFDQLFNIISSCVYLYFVIAQWQKITDQDQRVIVCIFSILLIGITKCLIIFRVCFDNYTRLDFHITIMCTIIHLINCSSKDSIFIIDFDFNSQNYFLNISYALFYCILLLNGIYFSVIGLAILVVAIVSLIQIWYSSDSIINREGLTSQEFDSLPSKIISAKEAEKMKSSHHSGTHNHANDCAICLSSFEQNELMIEMIQCKHVFHSDCIKVWFKNSILCPYCRNDVRKALQKIKREKHQLQHAGHSILDKIVDQAEPSFQLEEFIEQNDLRTQLEQPQIIQQQQQFQDINQNQIHVQINNPDNMNLNNVAAGGRNSNQIFQNNQQLREEINENQQSQQQNHSILPQNINGQNYHSRIYSASPRFPLNDEILSQSQSIQPLQSSRNQQSPQIQFFVNQNQQQEQVQQQSQQQQQQQLQQQQQQQRQPIRIVEPPSPRQKKNQRNSSNHHSRQNSFGSDDDKFIEQLQQQQQSFQLQLKNSASNSPLHNGEIEFNNLNYYADGAGYSNNKNILDDFSFNEEQKEVIQLQKTEK